MITPSQGVHHCHSDVFVRGKLLAGARGSRVRLLGRDDTQEAYSPREGSARAGSGVADRVDSDHQVTARKSAFCLFERGGRGGSTGLGLWKHQLICFD